MNVVISDSDSDGSCVTILDFDKFSVEDCVMQNSLACFTKL